MTPFPLAPAAFSGDPRVVPLDAPFNWLRQGWAVFVAEPRRWLVMTVLPAALLGLLAVFLGLPIVLLAGSLVAALLLPALLAGLLCAVQRLGDEGRFAPADLFAGFRNNTAPLVLLGVLFMAAWALILLAVTIGGSGGGIVAGQAGMAVDLAGFFLVLLLKLLLAIPLCLVLCLAIWFAPALVYFNGMAPLAALQASFAAALRNWLAMLVFGLLALVLGFFAALPMGLGFLVLIPVLIGALHASHKDIFLG